MPRGLVSTAVAGQSVVGAQVGEVFYRRTVARGVWQNDGSPIFFSFLLPWLHITPEEAQVGRADS